GSTGGPRTAFAPFVASPEVAAILAGRLAGRGGVHGLAAVRFQPGRGPGDSAAATGASGPVLRLLSGRLPELAGSVSAQGIPVPAAGGAASADSPRGRKAARADACPAGGGGRGRCAGSGPAVFARAVCEFDGRPGRDGGCRLGLSGDLSSTCRATVPELYRWVKV